MRRLVMTLALVTAVVGIAALAQAAGPEGYRWHEGRWWYQMPDQSWLYWESNRWNECGPTSWTTARMSYSDEGIAAANPAIASPVSPFDSGWSTTGAGWGSSRGAGWGSSGGGGSWANSAVGSWGGNYFGRPVN